MDIKLNYIKTGKGDNLILLHGNGEDYSYFENLAFKDYIDLKNSPRADVGINTFIEFMYDNRFPNLKISDADKGEFYYNKNGELIGYSQEEARRNLQQKNN